MEWDLTPDDVRIGDVDYSVAEVWKISRTD
jgi:hypothetical protein